MSDPKGMNTDTPRDPVDGNAESLAELIDAIEDTGTVTDGNDDDDGFGDD